MSVPIGNADDRPDDQADDESCQVVRDVAGIAVASEWNGYQLDRLDGDGKSRNPGAGKDLDP